MSGATKFWAKPLIAAPFTPMHTNGELNAGLLDKYADYLVKQNYTGVFVNGSLGEGLSLTQSERKKSLEGWIKASKGRLEIIVHVGSNCIKDSVELSRHAEQVGATAIAALTPFYYKPENEEVLLDVMAEIAAGAPNTPFYYYDINFLTGLYIDVHKFMVMAKKRIPTCRGLKHSSRELPNAHACKMINDCQVLIGSDNQYLSCLALDMPGVVTSSYLGQLFTDMAKAFDAGDLVTARKHQETSQAFMTLLEKHGGGMNVSKALFTILSGLDVGPVRLPLRQLTPAQCDALRKDAEADGLSGIGKM